MPRFDGTGPMGQGPMTGRGMGPCGGCSPFGWRMGFRKGMGRGMGRGFGRGPRDGRGGGAGGGGRKN